MKRRRVIQPVVVLLLLGAIVNVAVAWGCATQPFIPGMSVPGVHSFHEGSLDTMEMSSPNADWFEEARRLVFEHTGDDRVLVWFCDHSRFGISRREIAIAVVYQTGVWLRAGWPFDALQGERLIDWTRFQLHRNDDPLKQSDFFTFENSMPLFLDRGKPHEWQRSLPFQPIWPGFAINTIFYAAMLWLLFAVPFALRRRRRIQRGLCPACAYDLRGRGASHQACPECGAAVVREAGAGSCAHHIAIYPTGKGRIGWFS